MKGKDKPMTEFKLTCPECSATVITAFPEAMIWERCPACGSYVWETYDLMMAEVVSKRSSASKALAVNQ
jgi:uncharacterized Zn finger protein